jgi:DNA-directed RNA polymerase subunit RPC12/RpoP
MAWFQLSDDTGGKPIKDELRVFPATAKKGKLRLVRSGADLASYVAEEPATDFVVLRHHPFSNADVQWLRLGGQTGGPDAALDARFFDVRVRADSLPEQPGNRAPAVGPRGLGALVIIAIALGVCVMLGVWLYRSAEQRHRSAPLSDVVLLCTECKRRLKVTSTTAGKKERCPQCGHVLVAPSR